MKEGEIAVTARDMPVDSSLRRTEEFRTWFFLTVVMAPMLAVLTVAGFGFAVWMYQLVVGPPAG